ncbi:regulator of chromosome condensation 1/beta-lactamase-inhibitor protein II, partial [Baffinella frigidus]
MDCTEVLRCGNKHCCVLFPCEGNVKCWGNNGNGQLGTQARVMVGDEPSEMGSNLKYLPFKNVTGLFCSHDSTCISMWESGEKVFRCWGANQQGQLGNTQKGFIITTEFEELTVVASRLTAGIFSAGSIHPSCARMQTGDIKCWGYSWGNGYGDSATRGTTAASMGDNLPVLNFGDSYVIDMDAGATTRCALLDNAKVKCWGPNSLGHLGLELTFSTHIRVPSDYVILGTEKPVKQISSHSLSTCALFSDGTAKCWGKGTYLGYSELDPATAQPINRGGPGTMGTNLPYISFDSEIVSIQLSTYSSHVVMRHGSLRAWGKGSEGILGVGSTVDV